MDRRGKFDDPCEIAREQQEHQPEYSSSSLTRKEERATAEEDPHR